MTDPTIELDAQGHVKMLKVVDPEVKKVLVPVLDDDTLEGPASLDIRVRRIQEAIGIRQNHI